MEPATIQKLITWDAGQTDTASVGQSTPEFELMSATGETIRLSDYQGKKNVVLIFIYGDT